MHRLAQPHAPPDRPSSHVTPRSSPLLWTWLTSPFPKQSPWGGGGKRKQSDRVLCGWSLGVIGGGPAVEEEGFLLETNWNNLGCWTWKALKFFAACEHCFLTTSCAMLYPLPAPAGTGCCFCSVTPQGLLGPYCFSHKNTLMSFASLNKYTCSHFMCCYLVMKQVLIPSQRSKPPCVSLSEVFPQNRLRFDSLTL